MFDDVYAAIDQALAGNYGKALDKLSPISNADAAFIGPKGVKNLGGLTQERFHRFHDSESKPGSILPRDEAGEQTGYWRGPGEKIRTEISDVPMRALKDLTKPGSHFLSDIVDHPELFKAYPNLKYKNVIIDPTLDAWSVNQHGDVKIGKYGDEKEMRDKLAHELQHLVQMEELFYPDMHIAAGKPHTYEQYLAFPWEQESRLVGARAADPSLMRTVRPWQQPSQARNSPTEGVTSSPTEVLNWFRKNPVPEKPLPIPEPEPAIRPRKSLRERLRDAKERLGGLFERNEQNGL
jgi:hypothetical protein